MCTPTLTYLSVAGRRGLSALLAERPQGPPSHETQVCVPGRLRFGAGDGGNGAQGRDRVS